MRRDRVRIRAGEILFDGRLYAREIEGLPSIFACEAREYVETAARRSYNQGREDFEAEIRALREPGLDA